MEFDASYYHHHTRSLFLADEWSSLSPYFSNDKHRNSESRKGFQATPEKSRMRNCSGNTHELDNYNKLDGDDDTIKNERGHRTSMSSNQTDNGEKLLDCSLKKIFPKSLLSYPCISVRDTDTLEDVVGMLVHHLESFTDSLVVDRPDTTPDPAGFIGGKEAMECLLRCNSGKSFGDIKVQDIMSTGLTTVSEDTKLSDLLLSWKKTRRAFSIIPNTIGGYCVISARKMLEIGSNYSSDRKVSDLPSKKICSFGKDDTVMTVVKQMFENGTRKIMFEDFDTYISDRIILEKMVRNPTYLKNPKEFLETAASSCNLEECIMIHSDTTIKDVIMTMSRYEHPYAKYENKVISPWDVCASLLSDNQALFKE